METTEPEFDIFEPDREDLYVPLQHLRSPLQFTRIRKELGIVGDELQNIPNDYLKILFSGHRGCGKTVELLRLHQSLNDPKQYFSIFVSLQEEIEINLLQPEDLYPILISKLLRTLKERGVPYDEQEFEGIAKEWTQDKEVEREIAHSRELETGAEAKAGWNFWNIFSAEGYAKGKYGYENKTTTKIRESIRRDPAALALRFRTALVGVRQSIEQAGQGHDLIFILDDFEKTRPEIYNAIFLTDPHFILDLNVHLICCVPIQTYYNVQEQATANEYFKFSYLPMIHVEEDTKHEFCQIVTKRADESLFAPGVLEWLTRMSGGSPRLLLRLVNQSLLDADTLVTLEIARSAGKRLAIERMRALTKEHRIVLEARDFENMSPQLLELLFSLNVLEYNGDAIVRRINPLLEDFFPHQPPPST